MSDTGGSAFPTLEANYETKWADSGMTLRDYFAAKAMQGDWAAQSDSNGVGLFVNATMTDSDLQMSAGFFYRMADAMMEARKWPRKKS